jgi:hypothetical protein
MVGGGEDGAVIEAGGFDGRIPNLQEAGEALLFPASQADRTILKKLGISPVDTILSDAGIEHTERPEKIEIERWASLAGIFS